MAAADVSDPEVQEVAWDLDPLVEGAGAEGVERMLAEAIERARAFAERHAGRVAEVDGPGLEEAMRELAAIHELAGRAGNYAMLHYSTDTTDPARGALVARVQERGTEVETALLFFELEWAGLDDERAEELLAHPGLDFARHHLRMARRYRPHLLSEPEEKVLSEKAQTGRSAWSRLFGELIARTQVELDGEPGPVALEQGLSRLMDPDRDVRQHAAERVTEALATGLPTRAFIFNTLLQDKAVDDRLRDYPSWVASRNLSNEASDESVQALVEAVVRRYDIPQRWYRLKARLLGLDRLADYDRLAPVATEEATMPWAEARELVLDAYASFSAELGDAARRFFDERWIDAPVRPGKRAGAFCAYTVPSVHPYVMLNWTARRRDALTLAHELGHGLHAFLSARQGILHQHTPLTVAETASVFGEEIVFGRLLGRTDEPGSRLELLASAMDNSVATVFRQVAMNRFEDAIHTSRREEGELPVERFHELWASTQSDLLGDSVEITDGYRIWWSYVHHFVGTPGYVYAYAYGQLLALSVYRRYQEEGESFVPSYLELLSAGGSRSPEDLGRIVGVDLTDPGFWDKGLQLVEEQLQAAERTAAEAGRV